MVSFCTECGAKVESSFKFCPICGSAINLSSSQQSLDKTVSKTEQVIICANCGEENSFESSVCDSCGAKLDKTKTAVVKLSNNIKVNQKSIISPKAKIRMNRL